MARSRLLRLVFVVLTLLGIVLFPVRTTSAADNECPPGAWCFPAGTACSSFGLQIQFGSNEQRICQEFRDANDRTVHVFGAGAGNTLTLTNMSSRATVTLPIGGSTFRMVLNPDDSCTSIAHGAYAVIRSPVHRGSAPEALIYGTQLVYTVAPGWIFTVRAVSSEPTDVCAALAGS